MYKKRGYISVTPQLNIKNELTEQRLKNVVGVIPGKSKKDEYVLFGGHYDHLGIGKPDKNGDSIYNGANDDAAGTTAVMMLAKYYAKKRDNERTLIFAAFTAEESGGHGSIYFSKQFNPDQVMAMFNYIIKGEFSKAGKQAYLSVKENIPFLNLFYLKTAFDYAIGYQIMETLSPGSLKRMEKKWKE